MALSKELTNHSPEIGEAFAAEITQLLFMHGKNERIDTNQFRNRRRL